MNGWQGLQQIMVSLWNGIDGFMSQRLPSSSGLNLTWWNIAIGALAASLSIDILGLVFGIGDAASKDIAYYTNKRYTSIKKAKTASREKKKAR